NRRRLSRKRHTKMCMQFCGRFSTSIRKGERKFLLLERKRSSTHPTGRISPLLIVPCQTCPE
ncbi:hypothetical protein PMAYCL1PPCAC_27961, partial [Pristionchus mayeri]